MNLRKIFLITATALIMGIYTGNTFAETKYGEVTKLADYLYKVTYTDYDYSDFLNVHPASANMKFGCSDVHSGQFFGRNFDFYYNDTPQFVLEVPAKKDRLASIGVAYCYTAKNFQEIKQQEYQLLPWFMLDGINEKGVAVSWNVCPANDLKEFIAPQGNNPGKENLYLTAIVRYLLDNAQSAKHAVKLLKQKNIINDMAKIFTDNKDMLDYGYHFMIADLHKHYIVEFVENKMKITDKDPIMTNFFNTLPDYTPHAQGVERYDLLKANYAMGGKSIEDMTKLMRIVQYSQCYDINTQPPWFSDVIGYYDDYKGDITYDMMKQDEKFRNYALNYIKNTECVRNGTDVWQTQSTSVYDLKNLIMHLYVQENYDQCHKFSLHK